MGRLRGAGRNRVVGEVPQRFSGQRRGPTWGHERRRLGHDGHQDHASVRARRGIRKEVGVIRGLPVLGRKRLRRTVRSEEHTSELQSLRHLVCRLLLEKKKQNEMIKTEEYHNKTT